MDMFQDCFKMDLKFEGHLFSNKKAMFFTIIVIFIVGIFLISYSIYEVVDDNGAVEKRVETMNNFVFSVEQDIPRYLYIAGFRSIFLIQNDVLQKGNYISDINSSFDELFFNGTLKGEEKEIMAGARYGDMVSNLNLLAGRINAQINFSSSDVEIYQKDPWNLVVVLSSDVIIRDLNDLVLWNKTLVSEGVIPIEGFEDPLYLVETNGQVTNKIRKTIYNFTGAEDLGDHVEGKYYASSEFAPSFIDRLEGETSASENGIESFVYLPDLSAQDLNLRDKSVVDHIYFSDENPVYYHINGMPTWFKIDDENNKLFRYGVSGQEY